MTINSLQIKKDRKNWDDALAYNVKYTAFDGSVKFSLQLVDSNELPDQTPLRCVQMNHNCLRAYSNRRDKESDDSQLPLPDLKGRYKAVYKVSGRESQPILWSRVLHTPFTHPVESGDLKKSLLFLYYLSTDFFSIIWGLLSLSAAYTLVEVGSALYSILYIIYYIFDVTGNYNT